MVTLTLKSRATPNGVLWSCGVFDATGEEYARTHAGNADSALSLAVPYARQLATEAGA